MHESGVVDFARLLFMQMWDNPHKMLLQCEEGPTPDEGTGSVCGFGSYHGLFGLCRESLQNKKHCFFSVLTCRSTEPMLGGLHDRLNRRVLSP